MRFIAYHATLAENFPAIMRRTFLPSEGNEHWLGDGIYFYTEDYHAYNWMYHKAGRRDIAVCCTIDADIEVDDGRILDLDSAEHHYLFEGIILTIQERNNQAINTCLDLADFIEGTIINFMFSELDFGEHFDMVIKTFYTERDRHNRMKLSVKGTPQKQVCIKEKNCIRIKGRHDFNQRAQTLDEIRRHLNAPLFRTNIFTAVYQNNR